MRGITNARPKDGVQTINNLAPDANGNFTVEAGNGVTITSGTNKITIDVSGGSAGVWTERTANNDWTDMFDNTSSANEVTAKKNIIMYYRATNTSDNSSVYCYIPKGFKWTNYLDIPASGGGASSSKIYMTLRFRINKSSIKSTVTYFTKETLTITPNIDFDNKTFSFSTTNDNSTISKSGFTIYTSD